MLTDMIDTVNVSPVDAAKAKPKSAERLAFLKACADMGDSDRIRAVGEFLSIAFKAPIPARPVTFSWGRYNKITGQNTVGARVPVQGNPQGLPRGTVLSVGKTPITRSSGQVAGEYILTIDGESLHFALGSKSTAEFSPKLGRNIVRTEPEIQSFKGRAKIVDPFTNLAEYLFFWMHPTNISSPARTSPDEQKLAGVTVTMEPHYHKSHVLPTISLGMLKKQQERDIQASNESIEMTSKLLRTDEATLKKWCKVTGFDSGAYLAIDNPVDAYRSHLNKVVNNQAQTALAIGYKERLKVLMQEGVDSTRKTVMDAIDRGILLMDDLEWYMDMKDENGPVPFIPLARYMVPEAQAQVAADWLCIELDRRRDTKTISLIEALVGDVHEKGLPGGRTVSSDIEAAVMQAIANESVKVIKNSLDRYVWVNSLNEEICSTKGGRGITKPMQTEALLLWASSVSPAAVLAVIGAVDEGH